MASSAPASTASSTCLAVTPRLSGSIPYPPSPARLSPESLRTTRRNGPSPEPALLPGLSVSSKASLDRVAGEAPHHYVLSDLLDGLLQEVADGPVRVLDEGLREQGPLRDPLLHATLDDPARNLLGLAHLGYLLFYYPLLLLDLLCRDVLRRDGQRLRLRRGHLQRDVVRELPELGRPGHEIGLAVDLDEHPDPPVEVDVGVDEPLGRLARALLGRQGLPPLAEHPPGTVEVAAGLLQRVLDVHHARRGLLAELLYLLYRASQNVYLSSFSPEGASSDPSGSAVSSCAASGSAASGSAASGSAASGSAASGSAASGSAASGSAASGSAASGSAASGSAASGS